ncbi:DUF930 domain-containing protein [uncultured Cohaesibacter sp.]|uniref:DUF930 domain-containing protein n=1 Tax=uncultured Cohaesibacter sp. TaxID=1002546 RepID=UPI002930088F|nr:DUF930 domain-containing protein [uncultured Cohaesibacter sp.]
MKFKTGTLFLAVCSLGLSGLSGNALAMDAKVRAWLKDMAPQERMIQVCNMEAMGKVNADRLVDYTFSAPEIGKDKVVAKGAAFRRGGHWYKMSYNCATSDDQMQVLKFAMKKGAEIPKKDWPKLDLFE